jgi:hypothetical protein
MDKKVIRDCEGRFRGQVNWSLVFRMVVVVLGVYCVVIWLIMNASDIKSCGFLGELCQHEVQAGEMFGQMVSPVVYDDESADACNGVNASDECKPKTEDVTVSAFVLTPTYPTSAEARKQVVAGYLKHKGETEIDTWICILDNESRGWGYSLDTVNSSSGALGFYQIMPSTAKDYQDRMGLCQNPYGDWLGHVDCAIDIKNNSVNGFYQWEGYLSCL